MIYWVTGASSGIGRETTIQLAKQGHIVIATARSTDKLDELTRQQRDFDGLIYPCTADVTDPQSVMAAYRLILSKFGCPDVALLNAGTYLPTPASSFNRAPYDHMMAVNYFGCLNCLDVLLPDMKARGKGQLAFVASLAGYRGLPNAAAYGASKAALINLAETLRPELEQFGIDVRLVNPGFIKTPLTDKNDFPMPFLMPVEAAAQELIKGLQSSRFEIVFPVRFAMIMKLLRLLPNRLFLSVSRKILAG